jgi:hypothetical protein
MRQAILTKFHGPTEIRGARLTARSEAGSVYVAYDYGLSDTDNHIHAAKALCAKLGWTWCHVSGRLPGTAGAAHVEAV